MGTCTRVSKTLYKYRQAEGTWGSPKLELRSSLPCIPTRTQPDLQELVSEVQRGAADWGAGPPVLNLFGASWSFSSLYTSEMSLQWKPSFNLEFNKNWLSITEHKQSCSINLSALFVLGGKRVLSAEADDRCGLKDKYYLYFSTRFLLMHILSCMGIWSTKKLFSISQTLSHVHWLHGNGLKEFKPRVQLKQDGEKGKFWKKNKHWNGCYLKCTFTQRLMNIYALKITLFWTYAYAF